MAIEKRLEQEPRPQEEYIGDLVASERRPVINPKPERKLTLGEELMLTAMVPIMLAISAYEWAADKYTRWRYGMNLDDYLDGYG